MAILSRSVLIVILLTAAAGALGGWLGVRYGIATSHQHSGLDELLHKKLALSESQNRAINEIEERFAARRKMLEGQMRAANRDLAAAIQSEPEYGPRTKAAITRFHAAESSLQQETVVHILAMRRVLTPEQARQFDREVSHALTAE
ncbi:MAG TPA: periplasmic heavy metal sensor [Rhizomicrobium sp.]|nr:periplasmic heavy metal sensor [Rhizomicrobium sp.]